MAYISIIDLPELTKETINGSEYLLITNKDLESNKLQINSITGYISDLVSNKINSEIDDKLNNAVTNSKVMVLDEGIEVGLANKINFIGATVNSFVNEDDLSIDVYIPSASISSHFNTRDGATNAILQNAITELRYIARPTFDGAPFKIGDWQPGSIQKCIKENIIYNISDPIFIDKISSFKVYLIQNDSIIENLEFQIANGEYSTQSIKAKILNKTKELSHFKCNASFEFSLSNVIKGRFKIRIEYIGTSGTFVFVEDEMFFDNNVLPPSIQTAVSFKTKVDKFLSGIKYIGPTSTLEVNSTLINAKNYTYPLNICDFDGSQCGLSVYNILFTDLSNINYNYDSNISIIKEYSLLNNKFFNSNLIFKSRVNDWTVGNYIETSFSGLVDTYQDTSTRIYEDFVSETNRLNTSLQHFNSVSVLQSMDLQVYNSKLVYPQLDFSNFYDNPNYSNLSGDRVYIRKFWHNNVSHSNGIIQFNSNITEQDLNSKIKVEISLDSVNWFNCCLDYAGGVLSNNSGCRINSDSNTLNINNKIEFTLGLNKFTNLSSNWGIYIKITFLDSAKDKYIDVLQITNW